MFMYDQNTVTLAIIVVIIGMSFIIYGARWKTEEDTEWHT